MSHQASVMIVLLVLVTLAILAWGLREHVKRKRCPQCLSYIPYLAPRCSYCHHQQPPLHMFA